MNRGHRLVRLLSGGLVGHRVLGMPVVELHTMGRKSGRRHSTLLTAPIHGGRGTVLICDPTVA